MATCKPLVQGVDTAGLTSPGRAGAAHGPREEAGGVGRRSLHRQAPPALGLPGARAPPPPSGYRCPTPATEPLEKPPGGGHCTCQPEEGGPAAKPALPTCPGRVESCSQLSRQVPTREEEETNTLTHQVLLNPSSDPAPGPGPVGLRSDPSPRFCQPRTSYRWSHEQEPAPSTPTGHEAGAPGWQEGPRKTLLRGTSESVGSSRRAQVPTCRLSWEQDSTWGGRRGSSGFGTGPPSSGSTGTVCARLAHPPPGRQGFVWATSCPQLPPQAAGRGIAGAGLSRTGNGHSSRPGPSPDSVATSHMGLRALQRSPDSPFSSPALPRFHPASSRASPGGVGCALFPGEPAPIRLLLRPQLLTPSLGLRSGQGQSALCPRPSSRQATQPVSTTPQTPAAVASPPLPTREAWLSLFCGRGHGASQELVQTPVCLLQRPLNPRPWEGRGQSQNSQQP
ncbi:collagen alpha-1(XVII) chain-like [Lemur catta]|uniref:collagen alpha-1(XVII) chain-like n=1 Tax=Lemur catta TaxID=9447 RepID=UPI001E26E068|nr:collagen alpha-1(XVII) chain-like [Lemur catta]